MKRNRPPFFLASFYLIPLLKISVLIDGNNVNLKNNINQITLITKQNYINGYNFKLPYSKKYTCISGKINDSLFFLITFPYLLYIISIFVLITLVSSYPAFMYVSLCDTGVNFVSTLILSYLIFLPFLLT